MSNATHASLNFFIYQEFLQIVAIVKPLLIMLIGHSSVKITNSNAIKMWILTVGFSLLLCFASLIIFRKISLAEIYDSLFPILRDTYPTVTGILMGIMCINPIKNLLSKINIQSLLFVIAMLLLPSFIFNKDTLMLNMGNSFFFGLLCFVIGVKISQSDIIISLRKFALPLTLLNLLLNILMMAISSDINQNLVSAGRFISSSSIFSILIATALVTNVKVNGKVQYVYLLFLNLIFTTSQIINPITLGLQSLNSGVQKLLISIIISVLVTVLLWVFSDLIYHQRKHISINNKIDHIYHTHFQSVTINEIPLTSFKLLRSLMIKYKLAFSTFVIIYLLSFLSIILMNSSWSIAPGVDNTYSIFTYTLFMHQGMILLNTILISLLFELVLIITKRFWVAHGITFFIIGIFITISKLKISARDEPVLPSDIDMLKSSSDLLGMVGWPTIGITLFFCALLILIVLYLEKKYPVKSKVRTKGKAIYFAILLLFIGGTATLNHPNSYSGVLVSAIGNESDFWNQLAGVRNNGPIQQFINNIDMKVMDEPDNYTKKTMQTIIKKYTKQSETINQHRTNDVTKQTIIFNLSESFSDPERVPNLKLNKDSIPFIRSLKASTTSGIMMSSGYGGGTANMEYMALTGLSVSNFAPTMSIPFTQLVGSLKFNPAFPYLFKTTSAIHPYVGTFYNRTVAYKKLGINTFSYLGSSNKIKHQKKIEKSPFLSDDSAYANLLDQINKNSSGQFINLVTMQNHFPFNADYYSTLKFKATGSAVDNADTKKSIENYATGINFTDKSVKKFITNIDKIDKPITIVWYGDHLPGIYSGDDMSKYETQLHETDYFIYSNNYARNHGIGNKKLNYKYTNPNNFASILLAQTNSKVSPFYAFMTIMQNKMPAISVSSTENSKVSLVDNNGKRLKLSQLNSKQKKYYQEYKLIQYDIVAGKHYLTNSFFQIK